MPSASPCRPNDHTYDPENFEDCRSRDGGGGLPDNLEVQGCHRASGGNDCIYGNEGSNSPRDPCEILYENTRCTGQGFPARRVANTDMPYFCVRQGVLQADADGNPDPFFPTEIVKGFLSRNPQFLIEPCAPEERTCTHQTEFPFDKWLRRITTIGEHGGWRMLCNTVEQAPTGYPDQNVPESLRLNLHSRRHPCFVQLSGDSQPQCFQGFLDLYCFTGRCRGIGSINEHIDCIGEQAASTLDELDVYLDCRYGTDADAYPWSNEAERNLYNSAFLALKTLVDRLALPGHDQTLPYDHANKSVWTHVETFTDNPVICFNEEYYPPIDDWNLGDPIPITVIDTASRQEHLAHLTLKECNIDCAVNVERGYTLYGDVRYRVHASIDVILNLRLKRLTGQRVDWPYSWLHADNPFDWRIEDQSVPGTEDKDNRVFPIGPHGERCPMQERDDGEPYSLYWHGLKTDQHWSFGPNDWEEPQPGGGGLCCGAYREIDDTILFGKPDDNTGLSEDEWQ
jgi:hypothetical protein